MVQMCVSNFSKAMEPSSNKHHQYKIYSIWYSSKVMSHLSLVAYSNSTRRVLAFHSPRTRIPLAAYSHSTRRVLAFHSPRTRIPLAAYSHSTRRVLTFHSSCTRIPLAVYSHSVRALLECSSLYPES